MTMMHEISTELSAEVQEKVKDWCQRFPDEHKQSAVLGGLHAIQHEYSYLPVEQMDALAKQDISIEKRMILMRTKAIYTHKYS